MPSRGSRKKVKMAPDMTASTPEPKTTHATPTPPSAPLLGMTPPAASPVPQMDDDDIPSVEVPESLKETLFPPAATLGTPETILAAPGGIPDRFGEHEALLQGFLSAMRKPMEDLLTTELVKAVKTFDTHIAGTFGACYEVLKHSCEHNEHAQYQWSDALLKMQEQGLALRSDPYQAEVGPLSDPEGGIPVKIMVSSHSSGDLVDELTRLMGWLKTQGFTAREK